MKTSYDDKIYDIWYGMLSRCYNPKSSSYKNYSNVEVCEEWLCFSNFNNWYKRYGVEGWDIDKDLFSTENKIYSPQTCCLLPNELNLFFKKKKGKDIDFEIEGNDTCADKKIIEEIKGLTLLELNDLVKAVENEFGVSAAAPVAVAAAGAAAEGGAGAAGGYCGE